MNSLCEFTETLEFKDELLAPDVDRSVRQVYKLFAVLAQAAVPDAGLQCAYIRADSDNWYEFHDEKVTQVAKAQAVTAQFGDDLKPSTTPCFSVNSGAPYLYFDVDIRYLIALAALCV